MPLLLVSCFIAPASCLHFDYIPEAGIMEGLIQNPGLKGSHRAGVGFSEKALSETVRKGSRAASGASIFAPQSSEIELLHPLSWTFEAPNWSLSRFSDSFCRKFISVHIAKAFQGHSGYTVPS